MTKSAAQARSVRTPAQMAQDETARVAIGGSQLLRPIKRELANHVGYSSLAGEWSEEVIVERWTLPPVDHPEIVLARHRVAVFLQPNPVPASAIVDGCHVESVIHAGQIRVLPQEAVVRSRWSSSLDLALLEFSPRLINRLLDGGAPAPSEQLIPRTNVADPIASNLTTSILTELATPTERLYGEMLCLALTVHLLRSYGRADVGAARFKGRLSASQARRVLDCMHAGLDTHLSVSTLAREAGLSDAYFARAFRATFDEPPHRLVLRWRLERAARLITRDGLPLADAATAAGFCDQAHLTNAMRRHFGRSPGSLLKH